jgi:hypothetical protein
MAIQASGAYNNPAFARAASDLVKLFGPPPASDLAAYSTARVNNQEADLRAKLAQMAENGDFDQQAFDRMGMAAGRWVPTQSFTRVNMDDATTRRGQDITAQTSITNNQADNQASIVSTMFGNLAPGEIRPALPGDIAGSFSLPALPAVQGNPKPLSQNEVLGQETLRLIEGGAISDDNLISTVMGDVPVENIVGPDGNPLIVYRDRAVGNQPYIEAGANESAAEERIARMTENLMATGDFVDPADARAIAVGIVDGRLQTSRHPVTGELQVIDLATGKPAYSASGNAAEPGAMSNSSNDASDASGDPLVNTIFGGEQFGEQYPRANEAFGVGGAVTGLVNTAGDALGVGAPYPEVQQTQADFAVLRENLLNDVASAYPRQPPSWLMQEIRSLTPAAGSAFEGTGAAQTKLTALGRHLATELRTTQEALQRQLSPQNRQELEARLAGLQSGLARLQTALDAFGGQQAPSGQETRQDENGWTTLPNGVRIREVQ